MKHSLLLTLAITSAASASALEVYVETPGTLSQMIPEGEKYTLTELSVRGDINGTDILYLREMAGADLNGNPTEGSLAVLDLSDAWITAGGDAYFHSNFYGDMFAEDEYIGPYMFCHCTSLEKFVMPWMVETLGQGAFMSCNNLSEFVYSEYIKVLGPAVFDSTALTDVIIPDTVEEVWSGAFNNCGQLISLTFGSGMKAWDTSCTGCPNLLNYEVSAANEWFKAIDGVLFTKDGTLLAYPAAKEGHYDIPEDTEHIYGYAFYNSANPVSISFPSTLVSIMERAFQGCQVENITFSDGLDEIAPFAFLYCSALKELNLPESLHIIGESAFSGCDNLTVLTWPDGMESVGSYAFSDCKALRSFTYPDIVPAQMGNGIFCYASGLEEINFSENMTEIPESTFSNATSLKHVAFPANIVKIGDDSFSTSALESIDFGSGVKEIGNYSFANCSELRELIIPDNVEKIGDGIVSNCLAIETVKIGNGVTSIGDWMFCYAMALTNVELGDGLKEIPTGMFTGCGALTSVKMSPEVTHIGDYAFNYCEALTELTLPETLISIGSYGLSGCGFREIHLPASLERLASGAFASCYDLATVTCDAVTPPTCEWGVFNMIAEEAVLQVPAESVEAYKAADEWKDFYSIISTVGINSVRDNAVSVVSLTGAIAVSGNGEIVSVYDMAGRKVAAGTADGSLISLPRGQYIITTPVSTHKVNIK